MRDREAIGGEELKSRLEALGLAKLSYISAAMRVVDRDFYTKIRIAVPPPHSGLPLLLSGPAITAEDLAAPPADTHCAGGFQVFGAGGHGSVAQDGSRGRQSSRSSLWSGDQGNGTAARDFAAK